MIKVPSSDVYFHKRKNPLKWGEKEFSILSPHIKHFRTCLDIGAHVGVMTLRYAKHFKTVHSFEPMVYSFLVENTKHLPNVFTHEYAISDKTGTVEMYPNPLNSTGAIIPDEHNDYFIEKRYTGDNAQMKGIETVSVECVTIDQFEFDNVDLIKIDVEGHILPVLRGITETLTKNSPVIQIEVSAFENINNQAHDILLSLGYHKFAEYKYDWFYYKEK